MIRKIKKSDINNLSLFLQSQNSSVSIKDVKYLVRDCVNSKKIGYILEDKNDISGMLLIDKKDNKNYLSIESSNKNISNHLLSVLFWDFKQELYAIIKKTNKLGFLLKKYKFKIIEKNDIGYIMYYNPKWKDNKYGNRKHINNNR